MMKREIKPASARTGKKHFFAFANQGARAGVKSYNSKPAAERWRDIDVVEKIAALFEPDPLVYAQFFEEFPQKNPGRTGEKAHGRDSRRWHQLLSGPCFR